MGDGHRLGDREELKLAAVTLDQLPSGHGFFRIIAAFGENIRVDDPLFPETPQVWRPICPPLQFVWLNPDPAFQSFQLKVISM